MSDVRPGDVTVAIIVTYNPDTYQLWCLLDAIASQVSRAIVIDNCSSLSFAQVMRERYGDTVKLVENKRNIGVASAQNQGIEWARETGAEYCVLFDQDSLPASDLILQLHTVANERMAAGELVAAVGPTNIDDRWNKPLPFFEIRWGRYREKYCCEHQRSVKVDHVISAGALIPMATIDKVGGMIDELFIDYIDVEWGLRAARMGFGSYGACYALMVQSLGNKIVAIGGRQVTMHSPRRDYYLFRNAIWMMLQRRLPLQWKLAEAPRIIRRFVFYFFFGRPWREQVQFMILGIWHGFRGRMGPLDGGIPARHS